MMRLAFGKTIRQSFNHNVVLNKQNVSRLNNSTSQNYNQDFQTSINNVNNKSFTTSTNSSSSITSIDQNLNLKFSKSNASMYSPQQQTMKMMNNSNISQSNSTTQLFNSVSKISKKHYSRYFSTTNTNTKQTNTNPQAQQLIQSLQKRGLIQDFTPSIERMSPGSGIYIGFDPTAG